MKTLLVAVNSKYIHSNLAVYSLKSYCNVPGMDICIEEFTINQYANFICKEIYKKKPDIVAFSCYIWNIEMILEVSLELKKVMPNIDIWLGGPEVSYDSEGMLASHKYIKGVINGEGEETFAELMRFYVENRPENNLKCIKGISYQDNNSLIYKTEARAPIDMDQIQFIYEDLSKFENRIIYYESSRGCPFGCSYCLSSIEAQVRFRSIQKVKEELQYFLDHNVSQVKFVDRTFNCSHERTKELLLFIRDHDNGRTNFHFEIAADLLNEQEIQIMSTMRPGLIQLEIGVQSTNLDTIKEIDRTMDFQKLSQIVEKINEGDNVHQHLDLIAGLPYENYESFVKSFDDVYKLRPEQLQLGFLKVLKGSKMYWKAEEYGVAYTSKSPYEVLYTKWLSYDEVLQIKNVEEVVELYYNSGQYPYTIKLLESEFSSPFTMFKAIADYYEEHHLFEIKHSRITRYEILLDFIKSLGSNHTQIFEQVLVFDLYLRENLKTRPKFAVDINPLKGDLRALYTNYTASKNMHIEPFCVDIESICKLDLQEIVANKDEVYKGTTDYHYIVFDYEKRNPLNYEASIQKINL